MNRRIGLYNENFKTASEELSEERVYPVREQNATFKVALGPLSWQGEPLKDTFVLEIHYKDSEDAHRQQLPLGGFNSQLCLDYVDKVHELASEFMSENGLVMSTHLNSWPEYQAVVVRK